MNKTIQPNIKDVIANIKNILKFEYPKTFNVSISLLFLKFRRNHKLEIKMIKGNIFIIKLGINNIEELSKIKHYELKEKLEKYGKQHGAISNQIVLQSKSENCALIAKKILSSVSPVESDT